MSVYSCKKCNTYWAYAKRIYIREYEGNKSKFKPLKHKSKDLGYCERHGVVEIE